MAKDDSDDIRIRPGRSRGAGRRANPRDLPFTHQVELAVRRAGGNPGRIGRGGAGLKGGGSGRFNAHGRGAKAAASSPRDGGIWQNAVNATPRVGFAYDPYFPRLTAMTDGTGTTTYSYVPVGTFGALQLQQEVQGGGASIAYAYDALGRLSSRTVSGAGAESFGYDALGRLVSHGSDLGSFTLSYLGETSQLTERALTGTTLSTVWSYLPNSGDRRLSGITDVGLSSGQTSSFAYTSNALGWIGSSTESADTATVYLASLQQESVANGLNQIVRRNGQPLRNDADI
ncbi:MAG: hypothetical protein KGL12_08040 [Rhodospirillales bacterium]|nr:hypothetical protein [Rhodospirillales bacterium]